MSLRTKLVAVFRLFALFMVMVAVALVSAITTIRLTIHGHQTEAPNLVGMSLESALRITGGMGLGLQIEDKLYNSEFAANQIVSQVPPRGARMKVGQHIHVLVSLGPPRVSVPNLVGESTRTAQITAVQRGLTVGDIATIHWVGSEADQILAQDPAPARADVHSPTVSILVSLGDPAPEYMCPSFAGHTLSEVSRLLEKTPFKIGQITPVATDVVVPGTILGQSPPYGSKIGPDTAFAFQVAGPPQSVPSATPTLPNPPQ